jgi:hypothetical protein
VAIVVADLAAVVADLAAAIADLAAGFEAEARGVRDTERWSSVSVPINTGCVLNQCSESGSGIRSLLDLS